MGTSRFDDLVDAVTTMRTHQRAYFAAPRDSVDKRAALIASKEAERKVDALLVAMVAAQKGLFG